MTYASQTIQYQVDSIVFEEGGFSSITWLLREGHLDYTAYRNWKEGKSDYLEDAFKTAISEIIDGLKIAQLHAEKLRLESCCQPQISTAGKTLKFCRCPANEVIFSTVYQPAQDRIQMDLFLDSAPVIAVQDLIQALLDQRIDDIPLLLTRLNALDPKKFQLFNCLLAQQKHLTHLRKTNSKIKWLLHTLLPTAFGVLGRFAHDFLTPFWQELSLELKDRRFDANSPEDHLSFTAFKAFQWEEVIYSIEREADWIKQPVLLFRYAEACFKLNKEPEGLKNWFLLFVQFPITAEQLLGGTGNYLLISNWRSFNELDPELEPAFFPAWMVLKKPALAKNLLKLDSETLANNALQLICSLVGRTEAGINETVIQLRSRLQQQNPVLFVHYMATHR